MGAIKKWVAAATGADLAADATERGAEEQAAAVRDAATKAAAQANEAAAQAARSQADAAARAAAQGKAADLLSKPVENADVNIGQPATESAAGATRKRRTTFGVGSANSGVNI